MRSAAGAPGARIGAGQPGMQSTGPRSPTRHGLQGRVHLWLARIDEAGEASFPDHCRELLPREELEACAAFAREEDRRRAQLTRVLLRETLSRYAPVQPADWRFVPGPQGKPAIAEPAGLQLSFNLSHARGQVVCALTEGCEIGVDLEETTRALDPLELEAYLKARGLGFALEPRCIRFDFPGPGRVRAQMSPEAGDDPAAWWFALPRSAPGHTLALALRNGGRPSRVRIFLRARATSTV